MKLPLHFLLLLPVFPAIALADGPPCAVGMTAGAPPIRILPDGTYEWVLDHAKTVTGRWRKAEPGELKYGYEKRGTTIILLKGDDDKNWLVSRELVGTSDGRDRILIERTDLGL